MQHPYCMCHIPLPTATYLFTAIHCYIILYNARFCCTLLSAATYWYILFYTAIYYAMIFPHTAICAHCVYAASLHIYSRYILVTSILYKHRRYRYPMQTGIAMHYPIYCMSHTIMLFLWYDMYCALCIILYCITQSLITLGVAFFCAIHMNLH